MKIKALAESNHIHLQHTQKEEKHQFRDQLCRNLSWKK